jgi:hypothetical protein
MKGNRRYYGEMDAEKEFVIKNLSREKVEEAGQGAAGSTNSTNPKCSSEVDTEGNVI